LPNFVSISDHGPDHDATSRTICYVGRLSKEKGVSTLIDAMEKLPGVQLEIVGDGPLRQELERKVRSAGVENISFLGHISGEEFKKAIRRCRFAVSPSEWYENNPRSIIELFAWGKPVVGARIGGIPELVRDGETGLTFEPGNAADLTAKISELICDPARFMSMGSRARQWVREELNSDKHYQRLLDIYRQAAKNRS
jgi:glycosyltransferase involved in cell wall biosynthesis